MNVIVFLGPTLPVAEARAILPAIYLPPASRGDVYAAARTRPWAIAIVDGYFHRVPSVLHKEVLWAMAQGVHVYGASSMGALRAAELERFGMRGVGRVFEAFREGALTDDDEVAVMHGPAEAGYVAGSEAMVNIRASLRRAQEAGVIDAAAEAALSGLAKAVFYPGRSWDRLLADARASGLTGAADRLAGWLPAGRVDQKQLDAVELLQRVVADRARDPAPAAVGYRFHSTTMWEELQHAIEQRPDPGSGTDQVMEAEVLDELRLQGERYTRARDLLRDVEVRHGIRLPGFLRDWMEASGTGEALTARAWDKQDRLARAGLDRPALADAGMTEAGLWRWYFEDRLATPVPQDLEGWAARHDFAGVDLLRRAVLRELLYLRKTDPQGTPA